MIENVVRSIGGAGVLGTISICIFFGFFAGMHWWAFRLKKSYLASMSELPLESEPTTQSKTQTKLLNSHE